MANILELLTKGQNALIGQPNSYGGLVDEESQKQAQAQARMMLAASLLEAGGPSSQPTNFGQALGRGMMAGQQAQQGALDSSLKAMLLKQQMQKAAQGGNSPSGVREYEYAKANGYKGSFEEWKRVASAQQQAPAGVQEYEYFSKLNPDQQKQFLSLQRSPVVPQVVMVNGVPTLVDRTGTTAPNPLSTQQSEIEAAAAKARAEAEAKASGGALGEAKGGKEKRSIAALSVLETLDLADPLIDVATGSAAGAARDKVAAFFGTSTTGDQASSQLKVLQADLMTKMPRMEGPQSDRDVELYREAAGQIGDPTIPSGRKKAAVQMIRALQQKYAEGGSEPTAPKPAKRRYNPATGKIE
jgi:hypothetical protein